MGLGGTSLLWYLSSPIKQGENVVTKEKKDADNVFRTDDGRKIRIKAVDPLFIQTVSRSVKMPDTPTYTTVTSSGREEIWKMDEVSAKQTEGGEEIWAKYKAGVDEAQGNQMERTIRAIFLDGTIRDEDFYDQKWERRMHIVGVELPEDLDERWVMYLSSSLSTGDIIKLSAKIMELTGVPEEFIAAAEESFSGAVRDR